LEGRKTEARVGHVKSISSSGRFLVMERLSDLNRSLKGTALPVWQDDLKASAFGLTPNGEIRIRDYGTVKLGQLLGTQRIVFDGEIEPVQRLAPDGADHDFEKFVGPKIGTDGTRTVHEVIGHPTMALKVCIDSHRENAVEWLVYASLAEI